MGWSRGLKLKLLLILLVGSAALAASLIFTFHLQEKQNAVISNLLSDRVPLAISVGRTNTHLNELMRYSAAALLTDSDSIARAKRIEQTEVAFQSFVSELAKLKSFSLLKNNMDIVGDLTKRAESIDPQLKDFFAKLKDGRPESDQSARVLLMNQMTKEVQQMTQLLADFSKNYEERNLVLDSSSRESGDDSARNMQLASLLSIIFLWSVGLPIAFSLSKKLELVTSRVEESSDEVANSSQKLASSSQQLSSAAQQQASAIEESAASLEQIIGMVESNLKNTEDSVKLANSVITLMVETAETIRSLTDSMDEIKSSNARVEALAKLIEEIGEKTDLIDEIVFQTKLLSFNASVEAERAGEHGRGFAVVAQEVGNLAQMSGKSAIEIVAIVKAAIRSAQEVSQATKKSVETGHALCKETGMKMFEVATSAQKILESSEQIYRASKEQNTGLKQISVSVESLSQATQSNATNAEDSASSSNDLFELSQNLKFEVAELFAIVDGDAISQVAPAARVKEEMVDHPSKVLHLNHDHKKAPPVPTKKAVGQSTSKDGKSDWDNL